MLKQSAFVFWVFFSFILIGNVNAQSFADGNDVDRSISQINDDKLKTDEDIKKEITQEELALQRKWLENNVFVPQGGIDVLEQETLDGSERGHVAVVEVNKKGYSRRAEKIFLYAKNFRISSLMKGMTACDVRFFVLANLDKKVNQLDVKLVWPSMTTTLSFSNVMPNTPTYVDYTLIGDGCYSMDKIPNVVVNRCRVRGMSAVDCANSIVWLKANK